MASRIHKKLDSLMKTQKGILALSPSSEDSFVVFSDMHRGLSDHADDWQAQNEKAYRAALSHYYHEDYNLILLGDIEELKEQFTLDKVVANQTGILTTEKLFHEKNKLIKVYGNHDSQWSKKVNVKKYLNAFFSNLDVYEGVHLSYDYSPDILLVHGHQGYTWFKTHIAERLGLPFYRTILNLFGWRRKTNYESYCKIEDIENEFYSWTLKQEDLLLIFGHTHRPLWGSSTHIDRLEKQLDEKRIMLVKKADQLGKTVRDLVLNSGLYGVTDLVLKIQAITTKIIEKSKDAGLCRAPLPLPILFNTGCCIFKDGDITGIEIANCQLRLIKWGLNENNEIVRTVLEEGEVSSMRV